MAEHAGGTSLGGFPSGIAFDEARAILRRVAAANRQPVESLALARCNGRVLAADEDELKAFLEDIQQSSLGSLVKERIVNKVPPLTGVRGFAIVR